ncbi:hypothetical protein BH09VER1_BH09VER1_19090 [soil metagenome]
MARPLVSVIIPTFNAERFLAAALDSALGQACHNMDVIVVDDESADGTFSLAASFAARDKRVRVVSQRNAGVGAARNRGIAESRGEFIAPLDADDFWYPDKLTKQIQVLIDRGERWGMSYCWLKSVDAMGNVTEPVTHWPVEGDVFEALIYRNIIGNASVPLFRATALREHRKDEVALRHQYYTWGLGLMAYVGKHLRPGGKHRSLFRQLVRWWFRQQLRQVKESLRGRHALPCSMLLAELLGGCVGLCWEYERSLRRVAKIRSQYQ